MVILNGRSLGTSGVNVGWWIFPSPLTQHCSLFFRILVFSPVIFCPPGLMCSSRRKGSGRVNGIGCSRVAPKPGSRNPSPAVQEPSRGLLRHPLSQLVSSFLHGAPCPGQACLGQGRWGWGRPSPITSPSPPSPASVPSPCAAFALLCVTHLLFCLKLPTSFIIDSSLSSQVSPLHGSTNCPLPRPPLSQPEDLCVTPIYFKS